MDLYQFCSFDSSGVKTDPVPGGHKFEQRNKEGKFKILLLLVCSYDAPGVKTSPTLGSQVETIRTKKLEFVLWGKGQRVVKESFYGHPSHHLFSLLS